jgi:hypothetical protein
MAGLFSNDQTNNLDWLPAEPDKTIYGWMGGNDDDDDEDDDDDD